MTQGLIVMPGEGERVGNDTINLLFKVTGTHAQHASVYENVVVPGFDVGAHLHDRIEECFYVLEGELEVFAFEPQDRSGEDWGAWQTEDGQRPVLAGDRSLHLRSAGMPARLPQHQRRPRPLPGHHLAAARARALPQGSGGHVRPGWRRQPGRDHPGAGGIRHPPAHSAEGPLVSTAARFPPHHGYR